MNKVTIAGLNIEFTSVNEEFFNKRLSDYENISFDKTDMILKTVALAEIKEPEGIIIDKTDLSTILKVGDNRFCRYLKDSQTGNILNTVYYNGDYSDIEIQLWKDRRHDIFSLIDFEYMYTGLAFSDRIAKTGGAVVHGSAISYKGECVIFSANSGVGKSTHAGLWGKRFKDKITIINDDKPAILFKNDIPYAFGTPWSGKTDINTNISAPVKAIIFIQRSDTNWIERLNVKSSIYNLAGQILRPYYDIKIGEDTLDIIDKLISAVPIYKLHCNISDEAVSTVINELYGG
jgi:hypothetical protein